VIKEMSKEGVKLGDAEIKKDELVAGSSSNPS
jgi:hypothetical protein